MNSRLLLYLLLFSGFAAAPFASLTVRRFWARVSWVVLLSATLSVVGCFAYAFDRSSMPFSRLWCATAVLIGIEICAGVFYRRKAGLALVLGAALVLTIVGLHFFGADLARTYQRTEASVRKGMTVEQVRAVIFREFAKCANYHVVAGPGFVPADGPGYLAFELHPDNINLREGSLMVEFANGGVTRTWGTAGNFWFFPWDLAGGLVLCAVCWWRLARIGEEEEAERSHIVALLVRRLQRIRTQGHQSHCGRSALLAKKTLMHSASRKVRQFAYFNHPTGESEAEKDGVEDY
jgi:hypothetical protein